MYIYPQIKLINAQKDKVKMASKCKKYNKRRKIIKIQVNNKCVASQQQQQFVVVVMVVYINPKKQERAAAKNKSNNNDNKNNKKCK